MNNANETTATLTDTMREVREYGLRSFNAAQEWQAKCETATGGGGLDRVAVFHALGHSTDVVTDARKTLYLTRDIVHQTKSENHADRAKVILEALDIAVDAFQSAYDGAQIVCVVAAQNMSYASDVPATPDAVAEQSDSAARDSSKMDALRQALECSQKHLRRVLEWEVDFDKSAYGDYRNATVIFEAARHNAAAVASARDAALLTRDIARQWPAENCDAPEAALLAALEIAIATSHEAKDSATTMSHIGSKNMSDADFKRCYGNPRWYRLYPARPTPAEATYVAPQA